VLTCSRVVHVLFKESMENLNVKAIVRLVGINENTLRGWERRYGAVSPLRDEEGRRTYSAKDFERIQCLWQLVQNGHSIGRLAPLSTIKLKSLLSEHPEKSKLAEPQADVISVLLKQIVKDLEKFDVEKLNTHLQQARFEVSVKEIVLHLILPLMREVGRLVLENKMNIADEHILSALLRDYLGSIYQSLSPYNLSSRQMSKCVILTSREGDIHEFGILLSAILSNLHRLKSIYLGPNMPVNDLIEACQQFKSDYLVLSLMKLPPQREVVTSLEYLKKLDQSVPKKVTFILGGSDSVDLKKISTTRKIIQLNHLSELDLYFQQV
jgi:MerR family transcriptional regulator, light-induced transcriptional regulator